MSWPSHGSASLAEAIAVVGMGCRLPGDVDSPAALWQLLLRGQDAVGPPPPERERLWQAGPGGRAMPERAGYLRDVAGFDADFFGVSGREALVLDPQHRLLLEVAWEALEHAGMAPDRLAGTATGVFTGLSYNDYMDRLDGHPQDLEGSVLTNGHCVAPGRISYLLGLHGPSVALDTACSSSLVALHLACQALRAGECDVALAGGVTLMLRDRTHRSFARMGMLSATGRCHTFDAAADGFVRGEGCGVVVAKRLADAVRDGDRVLAVVHGSAVNQDGRSDGLAAPSATAQRAVYEAALRTAGIRPEDVGLIETHGTGTPLGDPTEFASLAQVYGQGPGRVALGSVKTNLGHLEPAAGITGLIKAVLCLRHGLIPANLHFTRWNPAIIAEGARLFVPTRTTEWPLPSQPRLAAVSSFGFSGTNAHVVLGQTLAVPAPRRPVSRRGPAETEPRVFVVPAGSAAVLPTAAGRLAEWVTGPGADVPLDDIAHTLAMRRCAGRGRLAVTASSRRELAASLRAFAADQAVRPGVATGEVGMSVTRRPVWVFSGQGSQWAGMGRRLLRKEPAFAEALAEVDALIRAEADFSVLAMVRGGQKATGCGRVQPALFALQVALAAAWRAYGIEPAGVIGHSMGEVAAAVAVGGLSPADGVRVICRRSRLLERIAGSGAMATVGLTRDQVEAELTADARARGDGSDGVWVAVLAAPDSTVVAGDPERVRRLVASWEARGIPASLVAVDIASHCPHVEPLLEELRHDLAEIRPARPGARFYSTVLDDPLEVPAFDADYWCANLRRPVRFADAVAAAAADRHVVYLEVAPHPVVAAAVSRNLTETADKAVVVPTLRRDEDDVAVFRHHLGVLHCAGVRVDWAPLYAGRALVDVPTVTFDRRHHWADVPSGPAGTGGDGQQTPADTLPGAYRPVPGQPVRHCWQAGAGTRALPWLSDHRVADRVVMPGAVSYAVALSCACELFDADPCAVEVTDVRFVTLLHVSERTELSTTVTVTGPGRAKCEIHARDGEDDWELQATAVLRRADGPSRRRTASVDALAARHPVPLEPAELYARLRARGLQHGPAFTGITQLRQARDGMSFWSRVELPETVREARHGLRVHPVLVDLCAQLLVAGAVRQPGSGLVLPVGVASVRVTGDVPAAEYGHARVTEATADGLVGAVRLLDGAGRVVLTVDGLRFARREERQDERPDRWFLQADWQRAPRPAAARPEPGSWLVIGEADGSADVLAAALTSAGARSEVWDWALEDRPAAEVKRLVARRLAGPPLRGVVVLCAAPDSAAAADPAVTGLRRTRTLLGAAQALAAADSTPPRLYAVTRSARAVTAGEPTDPGQGALRGLIRTLAFEHPDLRATLVDTGPADAWFHDVVPELLDGGGEDEVALREGVRYAARLTYAPLSDQERAAACARTVRYCIDGARLRVGSLGDLDSLELVTAPRAAPGPGPGEVEVRVEAAGVNFRDVLTAMGLLPSTAHGEDVRDRIGFECAGTVTAAGPDAGGVRVGDRVMAVRMRGGAFGTFVTVPAELTAPLPPGLDAKTAAGLPIAYLTAWYALRDVARLQPGERVLIHSATGGTGQAAIAVAQRLGAEVLATAGSEDKRRLLRGMGITHVMDSRSLDFGEQTRAATGGEGVDVVLNSLSGPAIRAGLEALRPFGRFVELGVRDILDDAPLGMAPLRDNISFSAVDLIGLQQARPARLAELLREVAGEFAADALKPPYVTQFPLEQAGEALRLMAGAGHNGKLVLTVPARGKTTAREPGGPAPVRPAGAYIVTGGLRGLGLATACWLAEQGAGHLVLNGRTPPSGQVARTLAGLRSAGVRVTVVLGDIAEPGTAERLTAAVAAEGTTLRGVVHSAMVLKDAAIGTVEDRQLDGVWAPKAVGAWRLHQATAEHNLDWFVVFSSMASLLGNPGQGAYAAANAWLDAFAAWRTAGGQPTLAVNWGPWGETGIATGFADRGYQTIPSEVGLRALRDLLAYRRVQTGVIPGEPQTYIPAAGRHSPFFSRLITEDRGTDRPGDSGDDIREQLRSLPSEMARRAAMESFLAEHVRAVLRLGSRTLDPQTPLSALGFDSLLSMELRARVESSLGVRLPGDFVWKNSTLAALAAGVAERLDVGRTDTDGTDPRGSSAGSAPD
jgi:phthioceranic/hydroxyphthioceranic acid synthase